MEGHICGLSYMVRRPAFYSIGSHCSFEAVRGGCIMNMEKYKPQIKRGIVMLMPVFMFWLAVNSFLWAFNWISPSRTSFIEFLLAPFSLVYIFVAVLCEFLVQPFTNGFSFIWTKGLLWTLVSLVVAFVPVLITIYRWYR